MYFFALSFLVCFYSLYFNVIIVNNVKKTTKLNEFLFTCLAKLRMEITIKAVFTLATLNTAFNQV